jgi:DNA-binding NtrC family response regulator
MALQGSHPIHLVLSDVVMPGMSGPAMVERMKEAGLDLRVLFLSGYPDSIMEVRRTRVDGFPLLEKPFDPSSLERHVREALEPPSGAPPRAAPAGQGPTA